MDVLVSFDQLRDFHNEIKEVLLQKDPTYKASFATCWVENLPECTDLVLHDPCMQFKIQDSNPILFPICEWKLFNWWWFCSQEDPFSKADEHLEALSKDARRWVKQIYPIATSFVLHHAHHTHIYSIKILRSYAHMCSYSLCMCLCILITTPFVHAQAYWYTFFWNMFLYWILLWMWTNAFCPATFLSPGKAAFERDCLQFARDVATVGQLYEADIRSESFGCITWWYNEVVLRNPTSLNTEPKQLQHFVSFSMHGAVAPWNSRFQCRTQSSLLLESSDDDSILNFDA